MGGGTGDGVVDTRMLFTEATSSFNSFPPNEGGVRGRLCSHLCWRHCDAVIRVLQKKRERSRLREQTKSIFQPFEYHYVPPPPPNTNLRSFTNSFEIKSIQSRLTLPKDSSSKSYLAMVTLAIVSISVSPINGEIPDILQIC